MKTKEELAEEALKPYECFFNFDLQLKIFGGLVTESLKEISTKPVSLKSVLEKMFLAGYEAGQPKWVSCKDELPNNSVICLIAYLDIDNELETCLACRTIDSWKADARNVFGGDSEEREWYDDFTEVTHWMPIPTLPKEGE